jgi:hypothetical protein
MAHGGAVGTIVPGTTVHNRAGKDSDKRQRDRHRGLRLIKQQLSGIRQM